MTIGKGITRAEHNAYGRGYAAGARRSDREVAAMREEAKRTAERAELAEKAQGIGHCEECRYWVRGGDGPNASACAWGVCTVPRGIGTPWGVWASADHPLVGGPGNITTTPRFGCVMFRAHEFPKDVAA